MLVAASFAARCWPGLWAACTDEVNQVKDIFYRTMKVRYMPDKLSDQLAFVAGAIEEGARLEIDSAEGAVEVGGGINSVVAYPLM